MTSARSATGPGRRGDAERSLSPRAQRSREKLLRAATEILVERGPRAVTVDAVAEESGVAKSTLYRHWSSRDELLVDVVRRNVPDPGEPDLESGFVPALRTYVRESAAVFADPEWARILPAMMSLKTSMPEISLVVDEDRASKMEALGAILELGVSEGRLPADLDVQDVGGMLFGPLFLAAITDDQDRICHLGELVVERFLASYDITPA